MSQPLNCLWIVEQDAVVEWALLPLISSAFTALLNCAEVGRRNRILTNYRFLSHSPFYLRFFLAFFILLAMRFMDCFIANSPILPLRPPPNI